ncbi:MAG: hypothetical protein AB1671_09215 [Thermodesulfobacteriota bacterium]
MTTFCKIVPVAMTVAFLLVVGIITQSAWGQVGPTGGLNRPL